MPDYNTQDQQQANNVRYYIGHVAEDKDPSSVEILVSVPGLTPGVVGALGHAEATERFSVNTTSEAKAGGTIKVTNTIRAIYRGVSNRKYPPDVVKAEQVLITKYEDIDYYFWESLGRDANLRKLETLRIEVSDSEDLIKILTDDNTYYAELDTRNGRVRIRTSKSNGEAYAYDFIVNTKEDYASLSDDSGNELLIDSSVPRVRLKNREGTVLDAMQKLLLLAAPEDVILKGDRQVLFNTPTLTFGNQNGSGVTRMNTKALCISASESVVFDSPMTGINGDTKVSGSLVSGPARAEGYSTGPVGAGYQGADTDLKTGTGTIPRNTPDQNNNAGGRHTTAWEQVSEAIRIIHDCLDEISKGNFSGARYDQYTQLLQLAEQSKMGKNRGE